MSSECWKMYIIKHRKTTFRGKATVEGDVLKSLI